MRGPRPIIRTIATTLSLIIAGATAAMSASFPWRTFAAKPDAWYRGDEAARLAANVLSHQSAQGDWPKNLDTSATPYQGDRSLLRGTFDNGATVGEMRFLARAFVATDRPPYREAFTRALDHVLAAQYPNGGWPQTAPPGKGYPRYITFNDNTMVNLLELLRDVSRSDGFRFVDPARREAAGKAFTKGIACILKCQIRVDGKLTAWCAQHDETTLEPRGARSYELPSLSGGESAGILLLLMSLEDPTPDVVGAVRARPLVRGFEAHRHPPDDRRRRQEDRARPDAPPLWARFYEIGTNRPFFCGRDGVKKDTLAEIEAERRNGYAWYGDWGRRVLERHARWEKERPR